MNKYHYRLGIPGNVLAALPTGFLDLSYSTHAILEAKADNINRLPDVLDTDSSRTTLVEVETADDGLAVKLLYRVKWSPDKDLVLALAPSKEERVYRVKTVWLQDAGDNHKSLNIHNYTFASA